MSMFSTISSNGAARLKRVLERIEVDHQEIDGRDVVRDHRRLMRGIGANREQPAVDARMQRLQPPVHHLGKSGELRDVDDRDSRLRKRRGGAAGGDDLDMARRRARGPVRSIRTCRRRKSARGRQARGDRWPWDKGSQGWRREFGAPYHGFTAIETGRGVTAAFAAARRRSRRGRTGAGSAPANGRAGCAIRRRR